MNNEKISILKMLEDGKITSDEAARLLDSVGRGQSSTGTSHTSSPGNNQANQSQRGGTTGSGAGFDDFAGDLSKKFETLAKDWEPKIQRFTDMVVEKTATMADKISKSLAEQTTTSSTASARPATVPSGGTTTKQFEMAVFSGYNELNLSALNGTLAIKGYNGDKITAKVYYKTKRSDGHIELMKLGNKYYLNYDENDFNEISVDAFVPENMFSSISLSTINGKLDIADLKSEYFVANNSNGQVIMKNISSENVKIEGSNGAMSLANLSGKNGQIENFNGKIDGFDLDIANMKLTTFNGTINMSVSYYNKYSDYVWIVETSNSKISLNLPSSPQLGYYIKALTSLSDVKIGLTGLNYLTNDSASAEAKSVYFDTASKRVKLSIETSNAPIVVN